MITPIMAMIRITITAFLRGPVGYNQFYVGEGNPPLANERLVIYDYLFFYIV